jgi:hypothetical protein
VPNRSRRASPPALIDPAEAIPYRLERNRIAHLVVELSRVLHASIYPELGERLAADVEAVLIAAAVAIGHTERRPMTASKIAHFLGMPRTTVLRKLAELDARGVVCRRGTRYFLTPARLTRAGSHIRRAMKVIRDFDR